MPKIAEEDLISYSGAIEKITRLGLTTLFEELREILIGFDLLVNEEKDANGGKTLRKMLDERFQKKGDWTLAVQRKALELALKWMEVR